MAAAATLHPSFDALEALDALDAELQRHAPFAQMAPEHRRRFAEAAERTSHADGSVLLSPASGPATHLYCVHQGGVVREPPPGFPGPYALEPGELFPVTSVLASRPVPSTFRARGDTTCLRVSAAVVHALAAVSPPWADFLHRRMLQLLELSQRALQADAASRVLADQSWQAPLADFARRAPLAVPPETPLADALQQMHARRVGSVLVVDAAGAALGILTRHDVLDRVVLAGLALATPIAQVMSAPVHTLTLAHRAHDAALLMARQGVRHVPISDGAHIVGIVSERDLFALQRLSLRQIGDAVDGADGVPALRQAAADIRRFAGQLLAQGVGARQITEIVSQLNDRLTARLVALAAQAQGLDLGRACWLAFGSEGRAEQTIASDQDNGLVFDAGSAAEADTERPRWLALGQAVNAALDDCGVPLCRGGIMAGQPACCLSVLEWQDRFVQWIEHGAPKDLLNASIFFDLRALAGNVALAAPLRDLIAQRAAATPRFLKQLADNALTHRPPLNWLGGLGDEAIDLKLQGTAIFVEAARVLALAAGVAAASTRQRLEQAAPRLGLPAAEAAACVAGFEHLQLLRLGVQAGGAAGAAANRCEVAALNAIDRRVLRETLRVARRLQQRIELDYAR